MIDQTEMSCMDEEALADYVPPLNSSECSCKIRDSEVEEFEKVAVTLEYKITYIRSVGLK